MYILLQYILLSSKPRAVATHPHALLEVGGKLLSAQRAVAVGAHAVHLLLHELESVAKDVHPIEVYDLWGGSKVTVMCV